MFWKFTFTPDETTGLWVLNESSGTQIVTGGCIYGGAVSSADVRGGAGIANYGTLAIAGGNIVGNSVTAASSCSAIGAGVYTAENVTMTGGAICGNLVSGDTGDTTDNFGAGIYVADGGTFTMSGGSVQNNSVSGDGADCTGWGGGIFSRGTVSISGTAVIASNSADNGGGILNENKLTMSGGTVGGNTATHYGGGVMNQGSTNSEGAYVTWADFKFTAGKIASNGAGNGAGIFNLGDMEISGTAEISDNKGCYYSDNGTTYAPAGGGVYSAYGEVTVSGGEVKENSSSYGGGIYLNQGTLDLKGGEVSGNVGTNGAGIYNTAGTLNISGTAAVKGNKAADTTYWNYGGGIYVKGGTVTVSGGTVSENSSSEYGGGMYIAGGTVTVSGGEIADNEGCYGGGMYITGGTTEISGGEVTDNECSSRGGGVYVKAGTFRLTEGSVSGNSSETFGGGMYIEGGTAEISGGEVTDNESDYYCGGIYIAGGTTTLSGGEVTDNECAVFGAGVCVVSGTTILSGDIVINGNSIGTVGENLCLLNGSQVTLNNLTSKAVVGVTTRGSDLAVGTFRFTTAGATADDLKYFMSDRTDYSVNFNSSTENDNYLELVTVPAQVAGTQFYAYLTLNDAISVNFKMTGKQEGFDPTLFEVTVDGQKITCSVAENGDVTGVLADVCPNQMSRELHVAVSYDGNTVKVFNYSVRKYCEAVFDSEVYGEDSELGQLCKAVLNYGKYAEDYDNETRQTGAAASTLNEDEVIDFSQVEVKDAANTGAIENTVVSSSSAYLKLESRITLSFKINYTGEGALTGDDIVILNDLTPAETVAAGNIEIKQLTDDPSGYNYEISIKNLRACQLSRAYTLKVRGEAVFKYGVYSYCKAIQGVGSATETLKTLCKAVYSYGEAAKAYTVSLQQN